MSRKTGFLRLWCSLEMTDDRDIRLGYALRSSLVTEYINLSE